MPDRGYIRFYRSIWKHPVFREEPFTEREAWSWLCSEAAWKARQQRLGEHLISLERGQVVGAVRFLAEKWQWSKGKVERYLDRLKNEHMLETQTETGITVITICNYDEYQGDDDETGTEAGREPGQRRDAAGTAPGQRRDNRKELNTLKEGEEGKGAPRSKRKRSADKVPMPHDWHATGDDWKFALDHGLSPDRIPLEESKFKNHFITSGDRRPGWSSSWRKWVLKAIEIARERAARGGGAAPRAPVVPGSRETARQGFLGDLIGEDLGHHDG